MIKLKCKSCGKDGIPLLAKIFMRKGRNVRCTECATEYNYSRGYGLLINLVAAGLGTLLFYLIFFVSIGHAVILWLAAAILFGGLAMLLAPIKPIEPRNRSR
ncbi:hypothetical protein [Microbulbifer pacificus]|uniref:hypothetical protein n=1 Tax=Microbulbifer pacificus TaxID=407164 RepID=UPI00131A20D4|nr:hypothetical protein [Microbulbifer pacificus]